MSLLQRVQNVEVCRNQLKRFSVLCTQYYAYVVYVTSMTGARTFSTTFDVSDGTVSRLWLVPRPAGKTYLQNHNAPREAIEGDHEATSATCASIFQKHVYQTEGQSVDRQLEVADCQAAAGRSLHVPWCKIVKINCLKQG